MGSTGDVSNHIAAFFEDRDTLPGHHSDPVRQYFYDERRWVMEAMPDMPEDEWKEYTQWVKSVMEPLGLKLISPDER